MELSAVMVTSAAPLSYSRPSLAAREEEQQGPSGRWRESAALIGAASPPRRQSYDTGPCERHQCGSVDRVHAGQPPTRSYHDGPPHRGLAKQHEHGAYVSRMPRSALVSGAPYSEHQSELVDPVLFPPVSTAQEQQQPRPQAAAAAVAAVVAAPLVTNTEKVPVDERDEFEKELDAVVAELEKVRRGSAVKLHTICERKYDGNLVPSHPSAQ